ncbi:SDR family oxidoreductase [Parvularcula sp. ZS-1/3]|uniref:SDR family oxidoreductase n=1 Tax=Parvularcula mediterranea TaxID=2732508 RepID=A0A7Y3RJ12_9PROT|nr:SDR family oxidoreductase [Parvularcula mediterranea]NNU14984.1 SDR family oxidoreductase [Parvularcula mediterranea]
MTDLKGKIALVTGGSRSLGQNAAQHLADAGADIIITYVRNEEAARNSVRDLEERGVRATAIQVDLTGSASIPAFTRSFKEQLSEWGADRFDILVNNAGITSEKPFGQITEEELDRLYDTNYKSLVLLTQNLEPMLNDGGRIITMGTGLTRVTFSPMVVYAGMKAAVETFTRYLAQDLGKRGITVNAVAPGGIDNDFNADRFEAMPQMREYLASQTALGRMGQTEDIGPITAFLASDAARWITGQRIEASGGFKL